MNDRNRRSGQPTRRCPQVTQANTSINQQSSNRPSYHADNSETYSNSNPRHPPNTITANSSQPHPSDDCATSICYSYLVAIISSFLVVLGIYLTLTKFNIRFLYISLLGFSIEAIGACIYCMSNIRASKLARRKQRINSNEFNLYSGRVLDNTNTNHGATRAQQITSVTHILSNRNLISNSNTSNDNNAENNNNLDQDLPAISDTNNDTNNNNKSAYKSSYQTTQPKSEVPINGQASSSVNFHSNDQTALGEQGVNSTSHNDRQNPSHIIPTESAQDENTSIDARSVNLTSRQSPSCEVSNDFHSSTCLIQNQNQLQQLASHHHQHLDNSHQDPASQFGTSRSQSDQVIILKCDTQLERQLAQDGDCLTSDIDEVNQFDRPTKIRNVEDKENHPIESTVLNTSLDMATSNPGGNDEPDLMGHQDGSVGGLIASSAADMVVSRKKPTSHGQQRLNNTRRTLVMGLSGEEELIEIDEEDLDNMSILPPSYESIATSKRADT